MFKSNCSFVNKSEGCWPDDDEDIVDESESGQDDPSDEQFLNNLFPDFNYLGDQKDERIPFVIPSYYGHVVEEESDIPASTIDEFEQLLAVLRNLNRSSARPSGGTSTDSLGHPASHQLPDIFCKLFQDEFTVWDYLIMVVYGLIIIISLFGNLLVFSVIIKTRRLHTITNLFIANLAFGDLLMTTFNIPFTVVRLMLDDWPFGGLMCSLVPFTQNVSVFVSSYTMTAIAVDRYQVISTPLHVRAEFRDGYWKLALIWSISLALSTPWAVYHTVQPVFTCRTLHRCQLTFPTGSRAWVSLSMFLIQFLVPLLVTMVAYTAISSHLWGAGHIGAATQQQQVRRLASRRRTIKMLLLVVVLFAVSWLPLNLYHLVSDWRRESSESHHSSVIFFISHILAMSNVTCNPFVYFWLNKHFRDSVKNCFFWMKSFRLSSQAIAGSTDFQPNHQLTKNSALVTDFETTSGIVIPLEIIS